MDIWWIIMNLFNHISSQSGSPTSHKLTTWLLHQISSQSARHQLKIWLLHHISSQSPPPHHISSSRVVKNVSPLPFHVDGFRFPPYWLGSSVTSAHNLAPPSHQLTHGLVPCTTMIYSRFWEIGGGETDHRQTLIGVCADIHKKCSQSLHKTTASPYTKHSQWVELLSSVILVSSWARVIKQHHLSLEGNRTFTIKNSISLREL